jgi:hypothetical protein
VELAHAFRTTLEFAKDYASALAVAQPRKLFAKKFDLQLCNRRRLMSSFNVILTCYFHPHSGGEACHLRGATGERLGHGSGSKELHLLSEPFTKTEEHSILSKISMGYY